MENTGKRFPEVDILRGTAIVLMVVYHIFFDLVYLGDFDFSINKGILLLIGRSAAILFIFTAGLALTLSHSRYIRNTVEEKAFLKYLKRGGRIFGWGLLVTGVTWAIVPEVTIFFWILHFLGISIILGYFFLNYKAANLILGVIIAIIGFLIREVIVSSNYFLWLGLHSAGFITLDYFPVFPWFSVFLIGITAGNVFYEGYKRNFQFHYEQAIFPLNLLEWMGQKSLQLYLIHQPVLIAILYLSGVVRLPF